MSSVELSSTNRLDLDDVRPKVAQSRCGQGSGKHLSSIKHGNAVERALLSSRPRLVHFGHIVILYYELKE